MDRWRLTLGRAAPRWLWCLLALYTVASLSHFVHNAEFIATYPNLPAWITRESVYWCWLGIASVGALGVLLVGLGRQSAGLGLLGCFGALGMDGLFHYRFAPCSAHTWTANLTIVAEVATGALSLLACWAWLLRGRIAARRSMAA